MRAPALWSAAGVGLLLATSLVRAQESPEKAAGHEATSHEGAAKSEAAAVLAGPTPEVSQEEINRALRHMRNRWQRTYGLVEVG